MTAKEHFLSRHRRYQPVSLPQDFSDEEMVRDWTLSDNDKQEISKYRKNFRLYIVVQLCAIRLYGRFLSEVYELSPRIVNYLGHQLDLPPTLAIQIPKREATYLAHRKNILNYLGFRKFDESVQAQLQTSLEQQAAQGTLPNELFQMAENYLLSIRVVLPGPSVLERQIIGICSATHARFFESIHQRLSPELRQAIDGLLTAVDGEQRSYFYHLKEYPAKY